MLGVSGISIKGGTNFPAPLDVKVSMKVLPSINITAVAGNADRFPTTLLNHPVKLILLPGTKPPTIQKGAKTISRSIMTYAISRVNHTLIRAQSRAIAIIRNATVPPRTPIMPPPPPTPIIFPIIPPAVAPTAPPTAAPTPGIGMSAWPIIAPPIPPIRPEVLDAAPVISPPKIFPKIPPTALSKYPVMIPLIALAAFIAISTPPDSPTAPRGVVPTIC